MMYRYNIQKNTICILMKYNKNAFKIINYLKALTLQKVIGFSLIKISNVI